MVSLGATLPLQRHEVVEDVAADGVDGDGRRPGRARGHARPPTIIRASRAKTRKVQPAIKPARARGRCHQAGTIGVSITCIMACIVSPAPPGKKQGRTMTYCASWRRHAAGASGNGQLSALSPKAYGQHMEKLSAILIVDDDADVRQAARLALAPHAERVETASSPQDMTAMLAPGLLIACCWT